MNFYDRLILKLNIGELTSLRSIEVYLSDYSL
jgi:hypothetical protein